MANNVQTLPREAAADNVVVGRGKDPLPPRIEKSRCTNGSADLRLPDGTPSVATGSLDWLCLPRFDSDSRTAGSLAESEHARGLVALDCPDAQLPDAR
jgi:hypothetical protein